MANLKIATALRNNMLDEITSYAGASAVIRIFSGTQPAGGGAETTLLVELTCSATLAPAASAGVLTLSSITGNTAVASGTATWWRLETSGAVFIMDGDVTLTGNNGDLTLNDTAIVTNGTVNLTGPNTIAAPNAA